MLSFAFQLLMIYLDPASLGLEFHLGKSTQRHVKARGPGQTPFVLCGLKASVKPGLETGTRGAPRGRDLPSERTLSGWETPASLNSF